MKRLINGLLILILAAAITVDGAYLFDVWHQEYRKTENTVPDVTSEIGPRVYGLDTGDETQAAFSSLDDTADAYAAKKVAASGGGRYTDSSGETHYVPSSSGGGYSGGGYSGGSSGGGSYDDGPGYLVEADFDETEYNYCQNCGTHYIGLGGCPNPNCEYYNP